MNRIYILFLFLVLSACSLSGTQKDSPRAPAQIEDPFLYLHSVAIGDRCTNCHVTGDRPLQFDELEKRVHSMNVQRKIESLGMKCQSCHQEKNFDQPHMPPGAPHWALPHPKKGYNAKITPRELCEKWLNPDANFFELGDRRGQARNAQDLLEHVGHDPLVIWTWSPGAGRKPSMGTHAQFVQQFEKWVRAGAQCPQ
ncbi:MAG: hypothetical protein AB7O96_01825 [Pseudobdellovibrionaceae bacterium]